MLTFPLHNAALDLKGKPPEELPHGLLPIPPEVRELVEMECAKHRPEGLEVARQIWLNDWTVTWYFENLGHRVLYYATPDGPNVFAVGLAEVYAIRSTMPIEEQRNIREYMGY